MTPSAWHRLGSPTPDCPTAVEAMHAAQLTGWRLTRQPVTVRRGKRNVPVPDRSAVLRDSVWGQVDVLGVVSPTYPIVANETYANDLDSIAAECGATYEVAGQLAAGSRVFVTLKLPGYARVVDDHVETYLTSVHSHDGSLAHTLLVTPVHARTGAVLAVHSLKPRGALQVVDAAFTLLDAFQTQAARLADTPMTARQFQGHALNLFHLTGREAPSTYTRTVNKVSGMAELFVGGRTRWDALVAVCDWWDHASPTRGEDRDAARALNAVFWPKLKTEALATLARR